MNVSSIVVKTTAEHLQQVINIINTYELCEVHFCDPDGKIVATIEGESISEQMVSMKIIQSIPFVFSASLAFSYCEDELTSSLGDIRGQNHSCSLD